MSKFKNTIDGEKYYEDMDNAQRARWMSLLVAIDTVDDRCQKSGISFDDVDLSPIAIKHFIAQRANTIERELNEKDIKKINNEIVCKFFAKNPVRLAPQA
jgi:hypothetical protein